LGTRKRMQMRLFSIVASVLMIVSLIAPSVSAQVVSKSGPNNGKIQQPLLNSKNNVESKVSSRLMDKFEKDEKVTFLVKFKEKADVNKVARVAGKDASKAKLSSLKTELLQRSAVISELKSVSFESQQNVVAFLEEEMKSGANIDFHSYHIVNGMAITATKEIAEKIAGFAEVEKILPDETRSLLVSDIKNEELADAKPANDEIEWNVDRIDAPPVWEMGIDGTGVVVASLDTGAQWDHPALKEKYRGYDGENVDHQYSWYDPSGENATPADDNGHGTHVTGTMVGAEKDGTNKIGVAPGAKWIAAKVFNSAGNATDTGLLAAAEWMLHPGGRADMAPDVINNSWSGGKGIDEWYMDAIDAWRAANIFPAFAAGNVTLTNPGGPGSVATPANYPQSFAVGNTDYNDMVAASSLRGPSPYGEIKPNVSAPGSAIRSAAPGGGYQDMTGTSMAAPAVAGVIALLRSVNGDMSVDKIEDILISTAITRTDSVYPESPNNGYGYGIVNAYDAVNSILNGIGVVEGSVTEDGEDNEAPKIEHTVPSVAYNLMDLNLTAQVSDNIAVTSVNFVYRSNDGEWKNIEPLRVSGDHKNGKYSVTIPGKELPEGTLTYKWVINDVGNNEVTSETYEVSVDPGITTGYFQDFEMDPVGWGTFQDYEGWKWGVPTYGPKGAASGEKVYGTNLNGDYVKPNSSKASLLLMPPIDLPAEGAYLQFKHWNNFDSSSGASFVGISTDMKNWKILMTHMSKSDSWESAELDLSNYAGQRVYIAFSDNTPKPGWYIDDVGLSSTSNDTGVALIKDKPNGLFNDSVFEYSSIGKGESMKAAIHETVELDAVKPMAIPMTAKVSVIESGRSVNTNPLDGSYSLMHAAGDFTLKAEAYGYYPEEQAVTIEGDGTVTTNFIMEQLPKATVTGNVTDAYTGDAIEGAKLLLIEDANITPVETDADGHYALTAYEGTYMLKVLARGFVSKEIEVDLDGNQEVNIELDSIHSIPYGEIGYDDGTPENATAFRASGNGWGVKMSLPEGMDQAIVTEGVFRFWDKSFPAPGGTAFQVEVWDASGKDGLPGQKLAGPINAEALRTGEWTVVDLGEYSIKVDGDFYMVYIQTQAGELSPGIGIDDNSPNAGRSLQFLNGVWSEPDVFTRGNYMIRARVANVVEDAVITSPAEATITNDANITVEGTASKATTIKLLNNGVEVGSPTIGEDGKFSFDTVLTKGTNEFKVVTILDGAEIGESAPVTVTLDTESPTLTIDSPVDGDKTNHETVTVEGTVSDENINTVTVNGENASVKDGTFSKRIIVDNGENNIEVVATDKAGNVTTDQVTVHVKFGALVIENLLPAEDVHLKAGESVKISFASEQGLDATFAIRMPLTNISRLNNATELPLREVSPGVYEGYWTAVSSVIAEGAEIEVIVRDEYGNEARQVAAGKLHINVKDDGGKPGKPGKPDKPKKPKKPKKPGKEVSN